MVHLYVQAHSNTILAVLFEPQPTYDQKSLKLIVSICLKLFNQCSNLQARGQILIREQWECLVLFQLRTFEDSFLKSEFHVVCLIGEASILTQRVKSML